MKNTITRKLLAAAAAVLVTAALSGCFAAPQQPAENNTPAAPAVTAGDVSGSNVSGSSVSDSNVSDADVSGSDVSGSDVNVQDTADTALEAYFTAFDSGDAEKLADLTCSPAMEEFLKNNGLDRSYLVKSFADTIDGMKKTAGGYYTMGYEVISSADATEAEKADLVSGVESLLAGSGAKVQAVRIYQLSISAQSVTSSGDVVSTSDAVSEKADGQLRLYQYDNVWYVFGD